ncbi:hypothetical protein AMTR_s00028p00246100 [Amborella trichopoda]|uniref:Uncharacterized protein n=1 Tax=Amborella trichopoda TaxID=13333 RepID=W1PSN1_AMBTC|nr:hypothetical protein AMTR_s00028p00246100 [Amborella trichopoda]
MISSVQETTSDPGVVSRVQEVGPATIEPMHESTPAPSSPSRMSLDPCPGEHAPLELGKASVDASGAANDGPITSQGDGHETDKGPEQHEAVAPDIMGDEAPSVVGGEELILSEKPTGVVEGMGDEGPSTSVGGEPNANVVPKPGLSGHSGAAVLSEMTEGAWDEGPDTF